MPHPGVRGSIDRTCSGDKEKEKIKEEPEALNVISMLPAFCFMKAGKRRQEKRGINLPLIV